MSTCFHSPFLQCNFKTWRHSAISLPVYQIQPCDFSIRLLQACESPSVLSVHPSLFIFLPAASVHLPGGQQQSSFLNVIWTLAHEARQDAVSGRWGDGRGRSLRGARAEKYSKVVIVASQRLLRFDYSYSTETEKVDAAGCRWNAGLKQKAKKKKRKKCEAAERHKLDKENWERPNDFSRAWGKNRFAEMSKCDIGEEPFSPHTKLNLICVITGAHL